HGGWEKFPPHTQCPLPVRNARYKNLPPPLRREGVRGFPPGALPQRPPSHPCGCRPGRLSRRSLTLQRLPQKFRQFLATGGSPAEYTQTRLRTQIVFFRHSRLQNLRQGRYVFCAGELPSTAHEI